MSLVSAVETTAMLKIQSTNILPILELGLVYS